MRSRLVRRGTGVVPRRWLLGSSSSSSPYSPELNPDEPVNADLKHSPPKQHRARNQAELAAEARRFFRRRRSQPHIVPGYFGGPHVHYILDENPMSF